MGKWQSVLTGLAGIVVAAGVQGMETKEIILSPEAAAVAEDLARVRGELAEKAKDPEFKLTPQLMRAVSNKFFIDHGGIPRDIRMTEDFCIVGGDNYRIEARLYSPFEINDNRIILYLHGGGWMQGNTETHDSLCREIAETLHAEVIAVNYRLAPEHPFPVPLEDVFSAYAWCCEHYKDREIIISGDSAGGNLAAALCIKLEEESYATKPSLQILFYPSLSNDFSRESFKLFGHIATLTAAGTAAYLAQYAGVNIADVGNISNKLICPLLEENADIFPRTIVISADCDALLDEQTEFVKKLRDAGVKAEHIIVEGTVHGFTIYVKDFASKINAVLMQAAEKLQI
jgi:acetyl esterase